MKYKILPFLNTVILTSGSIVILIGILVIVGWIFDITILKSLNPDYISMKANTALCFIFSGILVILLRDSHLTIKFRYLIKIISITVLIISAINLFEYIFNWNSGIDELLFNEGSGTTATIHPGRMAINTAVCFILISFSILILDTRFVWCNLVSQFLALITGLICVIPQIGYVYKESDFFTFAYQTPMALNTAISFFTLSIGVLILRPKQGILKLLGTEGPGGFFAIRLFPVVFFLPVFLLWSLMALRASGVVVGNNYILAVFIVYGIVFFFAFWKIINKLNESDSERRIVENNLKKSEEKYHAIFETSSIAIMLTSPDGSIISANESACNLFDMTEEEICRSGRSGLVDLNDPFLSDLLEERSRTGKSKGQLSFYKKGGIKFQAEVSSVVFTDKEGNKFTSMVLRDLTQQLRSEETLKKSETRLRSYFDFSGVGVAITSPSTGWVEVNDKLCRMLGYSSEEIYDSTWPQLTHPDDLNIDLENFNQVISGKIDEYSIDKRFLRKDGETIWTNLSVSCARNQSGQVDFFVALLFDITDRKRVEAELIKAKLKAEEADRLKTAFIHNISHEIRTPLNAILGFGALLSDPTITNDEQTSYLASIQEGSDQLISIISTLLDISGAEANTLIKHETYFNINSTLRSLYNQFSLKTTENSNTLELYTELNDENAELYTDSTRLIQIISNLLVNALKFTTNGKVEFGYKVKNGELEFYIFDSGIGIAADQHSRIFDRFYQVEGALNRKYGGTGLGLSICKAFVELLGGRIWLTSVPGAGSQFYFTIPFEGIKSIPTIKQVESKVIDISNAASLIILVVEDNDINFHLIKSYLSGQNVKLLIAQNGKEAFDICSSEKDIDIVLMDIRMPVMDGFTATKLIKELRPDLPVIAQTAYVEEREKILQSGFVDIIAKPFRKNDLLRILDKHLVK